MLPVMDAEPATKAGRRPVTHTMIGARDVRDREWGTDPPDRGSDQGICRIRRGQRRQSAHRPRSIHALIGPNGAGKTTCFNLLTKFLQPTRGRILYKGRDITSLAPADVARLGLVRSFQISAVFPHLTVLENVRIALQRRRGGSFDFWRSKQVLETFDARATALIADVGLAGFSQAMAVELPYGRKRALEIATTLALDPEMLLLDEPTAGMGHEDIDRITDLSRRPRPTGPC